MIIKTYFGSILFWTGGCLTYFSYYPNILLSFLLKSGHCIYASCLESHLMNCLDFKQQQILDHQMSPKVFPLIYIFYNFFKTNE